MPKTEALVKQTKIVLTPDHRKTVLRQYYPGPESRIASVANRVNALSETAVASELKVLCARFSKRHLKIEAKLLTHFQTAEKYFAADDEFSTNKKLLIGTYFTQEYAYESAALFNPSIVPHPDQSDLPIGSVRFIMSLRATGEGHISSMTFRTGVIDAVCHISIDPVSRYPEIAPIKQDSSYDNVRFGLKLAEMGYENDFTRSIQSALPDFFTLDQLRDALSIFIAQNHRHSEHDKQTHDKILCLALANYEVSFPGQHPLSSWVVFPAFPSEANGIEDVRFVRFVDEDGSVRYYATYTAYDGKAIMPQLFETDFQSLRVVTLNGAAVQNKGMALFPRKINGKYVMLSRQDSVNISLMYSDRIHFWEEAVKIVEPQYVWEFLQVGNCGSPIETESGWLLLTHGVGPLREYSIGALLLDLDDPSKVIGRLEKPIIVPSGAFKGGYVPNVVYTCGSLVHQGRLIVPYGVSDINTTIVTIDLNDLLQLLHP